MPNNRCQSLPSSCWDQVSQHTLLMANPSLRSSESVERTTIAIWNRTRRDIEMMWINYEGQEVSYGIIDRETPPLKPLIVKTFVGHPWRFYLAGTRLLLNVFQPGQPVTDVLWPQKLPAQHSAKPQVNYVFVFFPVLSLRHSCLQKLRDLKLTEDSLNKLCIPDILKADFKHFLAHS